VPVIVLRGRRPSLAKMDPTWAGSRRASRSGSPPAVTGTVKSRPEARSSPPPA